MQRAAATEAKSVVLVGAGHAHAGVLRLFGERPLENAIVTLISRARYAPYSGMLPGLIAGHYHIDDIHIDAARLAQAVGARFFPDEVQGLDLQRRLVICRDSPPVHYDLLSLDIGSTPNTSDVLGADTYALAVKPIDGFLAQFEALLARILERRGRARIACVGGGAGGVELVLAVAQRLRREVAAAGYSAAALSFLLVTAGDAILPECPAAFRARFGAVLAERGVELVTGAVVTAVGPGRLEFVDRAAIPVDEVLWTTQAAATPWLGDSGLPVDARGFVRVDETLRVVGHDDIFAAGDVSAFTPRPLPKSGVYAVRAGPVIAHNLRAVLMHAPQRPFKPQKNALYLVSTGERYAIGTRNGFTFAGRWVWHLKDWIDRRFMQQFKFSQGDATRA